MSSHLERAIAKDLGDDRGGEVGDDREQDRHPGCVQEDEDNVEGAMFDYASDIDLPHHKKNDCTKVMSKELRNHILMNKKDDDSVEKQTHNLPNRIRNRASLLVLAVWTLGDHVAP